MLVLNSFHSYKIIVTTFGIVLGSLNDRLDLTLLLESTLSAEGVASSWVAVSLELTEASKDDGVAEETFGDSKDDAVAEVVGASKEEGSGFESIDVSEATDEDDAVGESPCGCTAFSWEEEGSRAAVVLLVSDIPSSFVFLWNIVFSLYIDFAADRRDDLCELWLDDDDDASDAVFADTSEYSE